MSIFISRHGESEYMLDGLIGGDSVLTAKGRAYAQQLPEIILPLLPQVRGITTGGGAGGWWVLLEQQKDQLLHVHLIRQAISHSNSNRNSATACHCTKLDVTRTHAWCQAGSCSVLAYPRAAQHMLTTLAKTSTLHENMT